MEKDNLLLCTILVIFSVPGILTNTSLDGKAFVFSKLSANSYVLLKPNLDRGLRQLTLCLRFFTDSTGGFSLFSAASRDHDNEILLFRYPYGFKTWVGGEAALFLMPSDRATARWESVCTTWDSATGIVQLWWDGQRLPRRGAAKGYEVKTDLVVMLGQDQDSYGACFDVRQSFVGEIAEVYLWDKVLTAKELNKTRWPAASNPLLDWSSLKFEIQGDILTQPL